MMGPFDKEFYYFKTVTIMGQVAKAEDNHIVIERKRYPT